MRHVQFQEVQHFRQAWLWYLLISSSIISMIPLIVIAAAGEMPLWESLLAIGIIIALMLVNIAVFYYAQIWRKNEGKITKMFMKDKEVATVKLDPMRETADIDESNNSWPKAIVESKFQVFKAKQQIRGQSTGTNPMQKSEEKKKGF